MSKDAQAVDRTEFLATVSKALQAGDAEALARDVAARWTPRQLCRLLGDRSVDVRRTVAITLGLMGDATCVGCLTRALHDADEQVNAMAEHGLWSIWFRLGSPATSRPFAEGIAMLESEAYAAAIERFEMAAEADPTFAEAYNQLGIAQFLLGHWQASVDACGEALDLMPGHFGAMAGMGHGYTQLGKYDEAVDCYRRALAINPRMPGISQAVERLEHKLAATPAAVAVAGAMSADRLS